MRHLLLSLAALLLLLGCPTEDDDDAVDDDTGDDDSAGQPDDDDTGDDDTAQVGPWDDGWPIELTVDGQAMIDGSFDGEGPIWWALDTGASRTFVDSDITGTTNNTSGDVVVGPLEFPDHQVGSVELDEAEAFIGWDIGGLAGQDLFADRFSAIDYKGREAHFMDEVPEVQPHGTAALPPTETPYELPGSIPVGTFTLSGASEIDVDLIADTGSGVSILLQSTFDAIDDGNLPRLYGYVWATNYGSDDAFVARIPKILITGTEMGPSGSWAVVIPDDNHLFPLLEGAGIHADGFIGYPFYRHFVVGVDGFEDRYLWWPYEEPTHIAMDEWVRVGIEPTWREGGFWVEMVYSPSDAMTQGVVLLDQILAIDGTDLAGSTLDEVKLMLRGAVGETRTLSLIHAGTEEIERTVAVEDLLPMP
jgi:hypothetical protein